MSEVTPYQLLAAFRDATGHNVFLRPFDQVVSVRVDTEKGVFAVRLRRYKVRELKMEDVLTHASDVIIAVTADGIEEMSFPDEDFIPVHHHRFTSRTEHEAQVRRLWEASCGTPGRGRGGAPIQAEREAAYFGSTTPTPERQA
jgi:hypothetical protein